MIWRALTLVIGSALAGQGFSFADVAGKWCQSDIASYTFSAQSFTVENPNRAAREFPVVEYKFDGSSMRMTWKHGDDESFTNFDIIDQDTLLQRKSSNGPVRVFNRCK